MRRYQAAVANMMTISTLLDAQPLDLAARVRQRTTHNIDMAIEPEEGRKPAYERLQSALPVRAKTLRKKQSVEYPQWVISIQGTKSLQRLCVS